MSVNANGELYVRTGNKLTVGATVFANGSYVMVEAGAELIINGNLTNNNNSNNVHINGTLTVNGNFTGGNGSTITGTGSLTTTGTATTSGSATVFGSTGECTTGPCFGSSAVPLPIELGTFEANVSSDHVELKWVTYSETNNDYFTIERSEDGNLFKEILMVPGHGNSKITLTYFEVDQNPIVGLSYYRLKQTDFDGRYTYSNIIPVEYNGNDFESSTLEKDIKVFPNPTSGSNINVELPGFNDGEEVLVVIRDIRGQEFYSKVIVTGVEEGMIHAIKTDTELNSGIYLVIGSSENVLYSKKLMVR